MDHPISLLFLQPAPLACVSLSHTRGVVILSSAFERQTQTEAQSVPTRRPRCPAQTSVCSARPSPLRSPAWAPDGQTDSAVCSENHALPCVQLPTRCPRAVLSLPSLPGHRAARRPGKGLTCSSCCRICCNWRRRSRLQTQPPGKRISESLRQSRPGTDGQTKAVTLGCLRKGTVSRFQEGWGAPGTLCDPRKGGLNRRWQQATPNPRSLD